MSAPVELLVIGFEGNRFNGRVAPTLADLIERDLIRVIDVLFVTKDAAGDVAAVELGDLDDEVRQAFEAVVDEVTGLVSEEDVEDIAEALDPESSVAMLLIEHTWAKSFADAVADSGGELLFSTRIPRDLIDELLAGAGA